MEDLARYALLLLGLVYLLCQSSLGVYLRVPLSRLSLWVATLVYCPECSAFWFGLRLGALGMWQYDQQQPVMWAPLEAAIGSSALGAAWGWFVPNDVWDIEQAWREHEHDSEATTAEGTQAHD